MRKTIARILLVGALSVAIVLSLASCDMLPDSIVDLLGGNKICEHTEVEWVVDTPANCKLDGVQHSECKECGMIVQGQVKIEKNDEHTLGEWEVDYEATCKAEGLRYKKCSVCKRKVETETIPVSTEHKYDVGACSLCSAIQPDSEGLEFKSLGDGTASVAGIGTCKDSSLVIPELTPAGERVVSIETAAFLHQTSVTSVVIPEGVTSAGSDPFKGTSLAHAKVPAAIVAAVKCDTLTDLTVTGPGEIPELAMADAIALANLTIGEGVTVIGNEAFARCRALLSLNIGPDVHTVKDSAFMNCSVLSGVRLGAGIVTIEDEAFRGCKSIASIIIPASVKFIGMNAFNCIGKGDKNQSSLVSADFEVTEGWCAARSLTGAGSTVINPEQLADKAEAAAMLNYYCLASYLMRN